jgi:hypothetical protein
LTRLCRNGYGAASPPEAAKLWRIVGEFRNGYGAASLPGGTGAAEGWQKGGRAEKWEFALPLSSTTGL